MAKKKKRKKKNRIENLRDLQAEKERLGVAIEYSEQAIDEDWESIKGSLRPKGIGQWINSGLPFLGQVLPVGKLAFKLLPNIFRAWGGNDDMENHRTDEENRQYRKEDAQDTGKRKWFKKGFVKSLAPFLAGTLASAAVIFRKKRQ